MRLLSVCNFSSPIEKKEQSLAYQQNEKKKSFVVRLFKWSVGIFFLWIIRKILICVWEVVSKNDVTENVRIFFEGFYGKIENSVKLKLTTGLAAFTLGDSVQGSFV